MTEMLRNGEGQEQLMVKSLQETIASAMQSVEDNFTKKIELLFLPIKSQLEEIQASLSKTSQAAETALEMGRALQDESQTHQDDIKQLKENYLSLAALQRENNLKFRGVEEDRRVHRPDSVYGKLAS